MIGTSHQEVLRDDDKQPSKEFKSKKVRSHSNIEIEDIQTAVNVSNVNSAPENHLFDNEEQQTQVGSIKAINVQPRSTKIIVTSRPRTGDNTKMNGVSHPEDNGVSGDIDVLVQTAKVSLNTNENISDEHKSKNGDDEVFISELIRSNRGLGLGLIDGMVSIYFLYTFFIIISNRFISN